MERVRPTVGAVWSVVPAVQLVVAKNALAADTAGQTEGRGEGQRIV